MSSPSACPACHPGDRDGGSQPHSCAAAAIVVLLSDNRFGRKAYCGAVKIPQFTGWLFCTDTSMYRRAFSTVTLIELNWKMPSW